MDANDVKRMLNADAERFCSYYLSNGKKYSGFWRVGDILNSMPQKGNGSFVVTLSGSKTGLWVENGTPATNSRKAGSLIDIIMAQKNLTFGQAIEEAKSFLGIRDYSKVFVKARPKEETNSAKFISEKYLTPVTEGSPAYNYLVGKRGLNLGVLKKYHVCDCQYYFGGLGKSVDAIAFPIRVKKDIWIDGKKTFEWKTVAIKYLAIQRGENNRKYITQEAGGENHLFGINAISDEARDIVICEGEIDALTVAMCGFNAVSIPMGAHADGAGGTTNKANEWITNDFDFLERFERIRLCYDNDEPGVTAANSIISRLGVARTEMVNIPKESAKDPNEYCALEGIESLKQVILNSKGRIPEKFVEARKYEQKLRERILRKKGEYPGLDFPYAFGEHYRTRMGEVTIVTGYPGHGKTTALNDMLVWYATKYDMLSCIASLEVSADRTLETLWRQACGLQSICDEYDREIKGLWNVSMDFLDRYFYFFDNVGMSRLTEVLDVFEYAARRYGVKLFCLDSLMCLDVAEDDYEKQKNVMSRIVEFAAKFECHVFVVCHPRKMSEKKNDEKYAPMPDDISGSGHLKNLAFNIITFHRNLGKRKALFNAQNEGNAEKIQAALNMPDAEVYIRKQREGTGELPFKNLWFDMYSRQFRDKPDFVLRRSVEALKIDEKQTADYEGIF